MTIVAYHERESCDPMTGEDGTLRQEWRVRTIKKFDKQELIEAWGPDWQRYSPFTTHVLEHRYIRRGRVEPWTPFQSANSRGQALEYIDDCAAPVDPALMRLQEKRRAYREEQARKSQEAADQKRRESKRREQRQAAQDAFVRMFDGSDSNRQWAERWNEWVAAHREDPRRDAWREDPTFMSAYRAVVNSTTVPAKRKAIREFLADYGD